MSAATAVSSRWRRNSHSDECASGSMWRRFARDFPILQKKVHGSRSCISIMPRRRKSRRR